MRLGDMLLQAGVVTELQLNAALGEQDRWGGRLGNILVRMGALTEEILVLALCRQLNLPRADLNALEVVPPALAERLDRATCERYRIVPLAYVHERKAVLLAMSDPFDVNALDDLTRMLGTKIEPYLAGDQAIGTALRRLYGAASASSITTAGGRLDLLDNAGNMRPEERMLVSPPGAAGPVIPGSALVKPTATPGGQASFGARVAEHQRALRAVAELLAERGYIPRVF